DSDADETTGFTECTELEAGENDETWDAGIYETAEEKASIGDKVWYDENQDGIQDEDEDGVGDVTVKLYDCDGDFISSTTTDEDGEYLFDEVTSGDYRIKFELPEGYVFTNKMVGGNSEIDSDADQATGITICTTLEPGENDMTWDAGIYEEEVCVTGWIGTYDPLDFDVCLFEERNVTVSGSINITPGNSLANVKITSELIIDGVSQGIEYLFNNTITEDYDFEVSSTWPLITVDNESVTLKFTVKVFDCDNGEVGEAITKTISWTSEDCEPPQDEADLRIEKSVDNNIPEDGDEVTFTVTVTNDGPDATENVQVTDVLPEGLVYQSQTTSQGTYNELNGIWEVGTLANGASATLQVTVEVDVEEVNNSALDLGPAAGYNLFVINNVNFPTSDTEGKMAVGNNAELGAYSIGDKLPNSGGTEDVLVVGNNLTFTSGAVYGGNVVYGNNTNLFPQPYYAVSITDGTLRQDNPIDFNAAKAYLQGLSTTLGGYTVNGTTTYEWTTLTLTGSHPFLNVFEVSGSDLTASTSMNITAPNGSVVIVNVTGNNIDWMGGLTVTGASIQSVIYNFPNAADMSIHGIDIQGTVLAPFASIEFTAGVINGQMIAKNVYGQGQMNNKLFLGNIPAETEISNVAEVTFSSLPDPDSIPGNGDDTEDDYSSVSLTINGTEGGSGDDGSGDGEEENWVPVGGSQIYEMISTMVTNDGNMYAGTIGGKIYRSTNDGEDWEIINEEMSVGFVWSIVFDEDGNMIVGTENGLYRSTDGETFTGPFYESFDVRALAVDGNGRIYAGTWGNGVFYSDDNGGNWTNISAGLSALAVHALTINEDNEVYAGTWGSGIEKYDPVNDAWTVLPVGYDFVWALGMTSTGQIYAGTYGGGVYRSLDDDNSWEVINTSLPAMFVYAVSIDANDDVYISSWANGVFKLESNKGEFWAPMGLAGHGVSSMMISSSSTTVYTGTSDGQIYMSVSGLTSARDEDSVPVEFNLMQNYPNPFNPTTTIEFSVAANGLYTLKIYNILGQEVATLLNKELTAGSHKEIFDARSLASGIYIYSLVGEKVNMTKKMILLK
ncbi:MAG: choice-of-anchor A family protein, partial [Melioribacteraceae bacterium]|nr:choice-of-anchor A family protein [Melioribacteraceae bacterium]MCF8420865.1 choice-of-anchor A family protein [Melioribacteraceae bacterium]